MKNKMICCLTAGILMMGCTNMPISAQQAAGTENWNFTTDYTKPLLSPGADSTQLNVSWYSVNVVENQGVKIAKKDDMNGNAFPEDAKFYEVSSKNKVTLKNKQSYYANKANVKELEENTTYMYSYTIGDGTMSEPEEYQTRSFESYQLMYVGDPQIGASGNAQSDVTGWKKTMDVAMTSFPNISYIISVGDQTESNSDIASGNMNKDFEVQWAGYLEPDQLKNIPVQTLVGNHESSGANFANHTYVPNESNVGTAAGNDYYYTYGSTLFIVLNTNNSNAANHDAVMKQAVEANPDAKWRVVSFHQDVYGSGIPHSDSDGLAIRRWLEPVLDKYDVDVVLTGHDHSYTRSYQMKEGQIQTKNLADEAGRMINPDGTVYMAANSASGSKYYGLVPTAQYYVAKRNQSNHQNYSILNIDDVTFSIDTYDVVTGEKVDQTYTIVKSAAYEDLQVLINKADEINTDLYTNETKEAFIHALTSAKALSSDELNESVIASTYADLNNAINALKEKPSTMTAKEVLGSAIIKAQALNNDELLANVNKKVVKNFRVCLDEAVRVYADKNASNEALTTAWKNLADAMQYLDFTANTTHLAGLVAEWADADMSRYVDDENLAAFYAAQTHAKDVLANENSLDASLTEAYDRMTTAISNLKLKEDQFDTIVLDYMIAKSAEAITNQAKYDTKAASWTVFMDAYNKAVAAKNDKESQDAIDAAATALASAYEDIRLIANEDTLQELKSYIAMIDALNMEDYSVETVAYFMNARAALQNLVDKESFTMKEFEDAVNLAKMVEEKVTTDKVVPGEPEQPSAPSEEPTAPVQPPAKNETPKTSNITNGTTKPSTGDTTRTGIVAGSMITAGLATAFMIFKRRKK